MTRTLLCFGDSNTHGTMPLANVMAKGRFELHQRWPTVVGEVLGADWQVIAEGHPGRTTVHQDPVEGEHKSGLLILQALLESHQPIDLILIMLGTNDLKARFNVSAFEIAQGVERLVRVVRQSACGPNQTSPDVLVVAPPPILETGVLATIFRGGAHKSQELDKAFAEMGERMGAWVFFSSAVCAVSSVDGIHYEADNQRALGLALGNEIESRFAGH
ncbi:MAG: SGNH/GDSL hydrolase family protein [Roseitalea sp.]|jgi:lysophospholipase L1-like esterase|nr:SGNH/GDSL hydrolase family protein [Roseitalea sp.]MBO6721503.1 SGNH/GDSL hydrolase family protein [Roseitalea sp.]MBO6742060.1 SGNH/GDSL hydrolase family protein [Roseitalea sp.]